MGNSLFEDSVGKFLQRSAQFSTHLSQTVKNALSCTVEESLWNSSTQIQKLMKCKT